MDTIALAADLAHPTQRSSLRILGVLGIFAVLSVVMPVALIAEVSDVGVSSAWMLTILVMVWSGARLAFAVASGRAMLFDFFFWVFVYLFMGLAPSVQIRSGEIATTTPGIVPDLDVPTAVVVWVGIIAYEVGRLIHLAIEHRRPLPFRMPVPLGQPSGVSAWRAMALAALGLVMSGYYVARIGFGDLFIDRYAADALRNAIWPDPSTRAVVYALAIYPLLVGIGALVQVRRRSDVRYRSLYLVTIAVSCVVLLVVVNPVSSARYSLGTVLFALAVYLGTMRTPLRVRIMLVATLAAFVFIFPIADAFRGSVVDVTRDGFFGEYRGNPDYDAFWQIANALAYVGDGLVQFGRQLLGSLFFWMPRAIWPDKPVDTGILLAQYRGYSFDNLSAPLWAEFLVNGGIGFVIGGFVVVGFVLRTLDRKIAPAFAGSGPWVIVGAIFPVYMTILLRGSLLQATGAVAVAVACVLIVRTSGRSADPAPDWSDVGERGYAIEESGSPPAAPGPPPVVSGSAPPE